MGLGSHPNQILILFLRQNEHTTSLLIFLRISPKIFLRLCNLSHFLLSHFYTKSCVCKYSMMSCHLCDEFLAFQILLKTKIQTNLNHDLYIYISCEIRSHTYSVIQDFRTILDICYCVLVYVNQSLLIFLYITF